MNNVMDIRELKQKDLIRCADVFLTPFVVIPGLKLGTKPGILNWH